MQVDKFIVNCFVSITKHIETVNTMLSFIWWIVGFYWVTAGGQSLTRDSPQLYWLVGIWNNIYLLNCSLYVVFCLATFCNHHSCCVMQALYHISCFRRRDCTHLCFCCMSYWNRSLLLFAMHTCHSLCSGRSGK